jgi:hypothetical protein
LLSRVAVCMSLDLSTRLAFVRVCVFHGVSV